MCQKGRCGSRRLAEIGDYAYKRSVFHSANDALLAECGHPCSAAFGGAREEVRIEKGNMLAVSIAYVIYLDILVVARNVRTRGELESV